MSSPNVPPFEKVPSRKEPFTPLAHTTTLISGARNAAPIKNRRSAYGSGSRYCRTPALSAPLRPCPVRDPEEWRRLRSGQSGDDRRRPFGDRQRHAAASSPVSALSQAVGQRQCRPSVGSEL